MKKLTIIIITLTIAAALTPSTATGEETPFSLKLPANYSIEPYVKLGTIDTAEHDHSMATAHKAMIGYGVNIHFDNEEEQLQKLLGFEMWAMSEPTDGDIQMVNDGMLLSGKLKYNIPITTETAIYPTVGLSVQKWRRNSFDEDERQFWGDLIFTEISAGIGLKHKKFFADIGTNRPFWSTTDSGHKPKGNFGLNAQIGMKHSKALSFGVFYSERTFDVDGKGTRQGNFRVEQYGIFVAYKF